MNKKRFCKLCGCDISERPPAAKYCVSCSEAVGKSMRRENNRKYRAKKKEIKNAAKVVARKTCCTQKCLGCIYYSSFIRSCDYSRFTHHLRGGLVSECKVYKARPKDKNEWIKLHNQMLAEARKYDNVSDNSLVHNTYMFER